MSSLVVKAQAQSDTILMRINERVITLKEFVYLYEHNSIGSYNTPQKCAEELIDFLLLSEHARAQGLDTLPSFREQLKAYQDSCDLLALLPSPLLQHARVKTEPMVSLSLILLKTPQRASSHLLKQTEVKMDSIYQALQNGLSFQDAVANYSYYKQQFLLKRPQMSNELISVIENLELGNYSHPFWEPQGMCIVKLHQNDVREVVYDDKKIDSLIDIRLQSLKEMFRYQCNESAKDELLRTNATNSPLFKIAEKEYTLSDFQRFANHFPMSIQCKWDAFVKWALVNHFYDNLRQSLDYRLNEQIKVDSLLVAAYNKQQNCLLPTDEELITYFEAHKKQYTWQEKRFKGIVLQAADKKLLKSVRKWLKKMPYEEWQDALRMVINKDEIRVLSVQQLFSKGDNPYVDERIFKQGKAVVNSQFPYVELLGEQLKKPEDVNMVKDSVLRDYMRAKRDDLMNSLRSSSTIDLNQDVLKTVN